MLTELRVRDVAVIRDVTLPLEPGLNVLTGETGAGKSMLIDALALLLGERASAAMVRPGAQRAVVEASFDVDGVSDFPQLASEAGVDLEDELFIVRREINTQGRNRAWANGSPSTVSVLAALGARLVDLHGQHESQSLLKTSAQRAILDDFGNAGTVVERFGVAFEQASALRAEDAELRARREDVAKRADYLRHVAREISDANLRIGEDDELDIESKRLANAEELTRAAGQLSELLDGGDTNALDMLGQASKLLVNLERMDPSTGNWRELFDAAHANVQELSRAARDYASDIDVDPSRLGAVEQRRDLLYRLKQKYGPTVQDVMQTGADAQRELDLLDTADNDLSRLTEQLNVAEQRLEEAGTALTRARKSAGKTLEAAVNGILPGLGMVDGKLEVAITAAPKVTSAGADVVTLLVTLNKGMAARPLAHVASGGELSRIMLALRVVLARHDAVATLVFDEVDQGIGGEVAVKVSEALAKVAESRQVLIITHLPQIAARAAHHLRVDKRQTGGLATADVRVLSGDDRVEELARMMGDARDPVGREHAREMLKRRSVPQPSQTA